jgi:1-deoxy-D-xylulose-5-phosphate reductoisomerase
MELPILYALSWPDRVADTGVRRFDPVAAGQLTFEPLRHDVFPAFDLGVAAGRTGGTAPCVFNAANEEAVASFLDGRISFGRIADTIDHVLGSHQPEPVRDLATVIAADRSARTAARRRLA